MKIFGINISIKNANSIAPLITFLYIYSINGDLISLLFLFISFISLAFRLASTQNLRLLVQEKKLKTMEKIAREAFKNKLTLYSAGLTGILQILSFLFILPYILGDYLALIIFLFNISGFFYNLFFALLRPQITFKYSKILGNKITKKLIKRKKK